MGNKTYKQYENEVRSAHPEWNSEQVSAEAKKVYQSDPQSTYVKPSPGGFSTTFDTSGSTGGNSSGVDFGFGVETNLPPIKYESYITSLAVTNKKAYAALQNLVKRASGKNIQDPTTLGKWVSRYALAMSASTDPMVKTLSVEDMLRNSAAAKISASADKLPSRQVYQYTPEQRDAVINKGAQSILGRSLSEDDKKQPWYSDLAGAIQSMMDAGTVTVTKKVKNPQTGKLENVTTSTPGYSEEKALSKVGAAIQAVPELTDDLQRKRESDFGSWIMKQIGGQ
jgi:hypothetical protein